MIITFLVSKITTDQLIFSLSNYSSQTEFSTKKVKLHPKPIGTALVGKNCCSEARAEVGAGVEADRAETVVEAGAAGIVWPTITAVN